MAWRDPAYKRARRAGHATAVLTAAEPAGLFHDLPRTRQTVRLQQSAQAAGHPAEPCPQVDDALLVAGQCAETVLAVAALE